MPRKTKEQKKELEEKEAKSTNLSKTIKTENVTKKTSAKRQTKKSALDLILPKNKKSNTKSSVKTNSKSKKQLNNTKKTTQSAKNNKSLASKTKTKKTNAKVKSASKNEAHNEKIKIKKVVTLKSRKFKKKKKYNMVEYYDLPYRYNQTIVKLLAQTPTTLFVYWDISDADRKAFEKKYGDTFFQDTKPVLIVHNDTLNYSFEVDINDFANSWYLHVADSKCDYRIELGRRPIAKTPKLEHTDYIYVTTSNELESPNDRILFNKDQKMVYFRNVKTGEVHGKEFATLSFMRNMGKIYNIYELYKTLYKKEDIEKIYDVKNPSSHPSSKFN